MFDSADTDDSRRFSQGDRPHAPPGAKRQPPDTAALEIVDSFRAHPLCRLRPPPLYCHIYRLSETSYRCR